jgi:UDP-N-acetylmuramoylalanine--D-glutamate ligase
VIATRLAGVDFEAIRTVLRSFKGVEHRIEYVLCTDENISFYNDSKSTNVQATITALDSFDEPVILLAGGLDRKIGFADLTEHFQTSVKALIVYGETAEELAQVGKNAGVANVYSVNSLEAAVATAISVAQAGDNVLLSPAAASWDMFSSFEERGNLFKELVRRHYN